MARTESIKAFANRIKRAEKRAREQIARAIVLEQVRLIKAGEEPSGGRQKQNAPAYAERKRGKPPLVRDGILSDAAKWRIKVRPKVVEIRPPEERREALYTLHYTGWKTFLAGLNDRVRKMAQKIVDWEIHR